MYENLSTNELQKLIEDNRKDVYELQKKIDKKREEIILMKEVICSRDAWSIKEVINHMLLQLDEAKDQISNNARITIGNELILALNPSKNKASNAYRKYSYGGLVSNLYIDCGTIIMPKLRQIVRSFKRVRYVLHYEFNIENRTIEVNIKNYIFPIGQKAMVEFSIPSEDVKEISKLFSKNFKFEINDYKEIIPQLVKSIDSVENGQIDAAIFGYYLVNV